MSDAYDAWCLGEAKDRLLELCGYSEGEPSADQSAQNDLAHERVDAIMSFVELAKRHSLPRKLLPFEDRKGEWYQPGERVTVLGQHGGIVEPNRDDVRVKLDGLGHAVDFPRTAITREGQPWTAPKRTR